MRSLQARILVLFVALLLAVLGITVTTLQRATYAHTRERVREELVKLRGFETGVHPGPVTCTDTDHQCHKTPAWIQLVGDKIQLVGVTPVQK